MSPKKFRRTSGPARRPLALQRLEDRGMLAGNVNISLTGTTLSVVGDSAANSISLDVNGSNELVVTGIGTTLSGTNNVPVANFTKLIITMNAGDDTVAFDPSGVDLTGKDISVNLGSATSGDSFFADDLIALNLAITSGNGSDTIDIDGFDGQNLNVKVGGKLGGAQSITLRDLNLTGTLGTNATAATSVEIDDATVAGATTLLATGTGADIDVDNLAGSALTIRVGASANIDLGTVDFNDLSGALTVVAGATSTINVGASGEANVVGGLATLTAGGNSSVGIVETEFNGSVIVRTATTGSSSISIDQLDIAGSLTINMGNGTANTLTLDDADAAADVGGAVTIVAGNAANAITLAGLSANDLEFGGTLSITSGVGDGIISLENVTTFHASAAPAINITTRNGDQTIDLDTVVADGLLKVVTGKATTFSTATINDLTTGAAASISLGASVTSQHQVSITNAVVGFGSYDLTITAAGGAGLDLDLLDVMVGRHMIVTSKATGDDLIDLDGLTTGAFDLSGGLRISTFAGNDTVTLGASSLTSFAGMVSILMGIDDDTLNIGALVDDSPGTAFDISNYKLGFDGGNGVDAVFSSLASFIPSSVLLTSKIKNFEIRSP